MSSFDTNLFDNSLYFPSWTIHTCVSQKFSSNMTTILGSYIWPWSIPHVLLLVDILCITECPLSLTADHVDITPVVCCYDLSLPCVCTLVCVCWVFMVLLCLHVLSKVRSCLWHWRNTANHNYHRFYINIMVFTGIF